MKKSLIAATVILSLTLSTTAAFAETKPEEVNYTPIQIKDADGNVIAQTTSFQLDTEKLPVQDVHDANGNVIGQTRQTNPQDSFGGMHYVLVAGGKSLGVGSKAAYIKGDQLMLPLRAVSEALGYTITWNADTQSVDLTKGAVWSGIYIGKDNFSFGKMATVQLGAAPELKDEVTFVPFTFFSDILKLKAQIDETGVIRIDEA
ncbi:copper amine oxidase N-terminal domain-containing protein [Paenibacillus radicis (ex Xue et al. 2023)]|uniref:Copper amine oxidase N-terminal domain-containing protein n=1 Tax=Paenibacillus radicis (ex Xue et al. 2023) TaxID=2972489 RepID=A0ABT1YDT3_9BACL|nr:copper amine oxidase N-terminal domain-containing protein [Paenibacillus radicis (ex Xue et al. 2023)]MCR8631326.1 copper amine oxidase N-terminal domain-containing protein [Paenibacillus radicis (ex Xue et al. 2023)]